MNLPELPKKREKLPLELQQMILNKLSIHEIKSFCSQSPEVAALCSQERNKLAIRFAKDAPFVVDKQKIVDYISNGLQKKRFTAKNVMHVILILNRLNKFLKQHHRAVEMYGIFFRIKDVMTRLSDEEKPIFIRILKDTYFEQMRSPIFRSLE